MMWLDLFLVTLIQALAWTVAALIAAVVIVLAVIIAAALWPRGRAEP